MVDSEKVIIQMDNINSRILNIPVSLARKLSEKLSFPAPNYWFSPKFKAGLWDGKVKFFTRPGNKFPTGLMPKVVKVLEDMEITYILQDMRANKDIILKEIPQDYKVSEEKQLRDYQIDTINKLANNKICGVTFLRGIINLATNAGKTTVASAVIKELYPQLIQTNSHFLFVTHSKEIAKQAKNSLEKDLGVTVGFIGDGLWELQTVTVALVPTLYKRITTKEFKNLVKSTIGFVADECHHSTATTWYTVLSKFTNASVRLGLTGTVDQKNPINEYRLYATTSQIINRVSNQYLIDKGYSATPDCILFNIDKLELGDLEYRDAYDKGIVENPERLDIISQICQKEAESNHSVLILIEYIHHGELIKSKLEKINKVVKFTNGQLSTEERQNLLDSLANGEIDILISTAILDEGVDVSNINAVLYARGMKSSRKLLQGIGRGLRKKADGSKLRFYDFIDNTHSILLEHSLERYKVLKSEGFSIKKVTPEEYSKLEI